MISDEWIEETRQVDEWNYEQYRNKKIGKRVRGFYVTKNGVFIDLADGQSIPNYDNGMFDRLIDEYWGVIIRAEDE